MFDYDPYDGAREDARSDARYERGDSKRYRYSCGDATCGASDCGDCRNGDDEDEVEAEDEEEAEAEEAEADDQVEAPAVRS